LRDRDLAALRAELQARSERVGSLQEELHARSVLCDELASLKSQLSTLRDELGRRDRLQSESRAELDARINRIAMLLADVAAPQTAAEPAPPPEPCADDIQQESRPPYAPPAEAGFAQADNPDQGAERS
jgi:DNA repair exonuclease SbcCD ATPase subunit